MSLNVCVCFFFYFSFAQSSWCSAHLDPKFGNPLLWLSSETFRFLHLLFVTWSKLDSHASDQQISFISLFGFLFFISALRFWSSNSLLLSSCSLLCENTAAVVHSVALRLRARCCRLSSRSRSHCFFFKSLVGFFVYDSVLTSCGRHTVCSPTMLTKKQHWYIYGMCTSSYCNHWIGGLTYISRWHLSCGHSLVTFHDKTSRLGSEKDHCLG